MLSCISQMLGQRNRRESGLTYCVYTSYIILSLHSCRAVEEKGEEGRGGE